MRYMVLIYGDEGRFAPGGRIGDEETNKAEYDAYRRFISEARANKVMEAGEPLRETTTATTVRVRDGKTLTTDGPFAETKEQLGGYFIFDCKDLDEALAWAAKIPTAKHGSIEVRPIAPLEM